MTLKYGVNNQKGFTLLELLISLAVIAMLVGVSMLAIRLAVTARTSSDMKNDSYQRLRFISEQLTGKVRSLHPMFVKRTPENTFPSVENSTANISRVMAFEGTSDSIHFITFGQKLSALREVPWVHETRFFMETDPDTGQQSLLMTEHELRFADFFKKDSVFQRTGKTVVLAQNVARLKFRYYLYTSSGDAGTPNPGSPVQSTGEWVDSVTTAPQDGRGNLLSDTRNIGSLAGVMENTNGTPLPRAVEISLGLWETRTDGEEPRLVTLPPFIVPLQTGIIFERPAKEENASS